MKTGVTVVIMGVLSFILPFVGLQFRMINALGRGGATIGGIAMIALGAACIGLSFVRLPNFFGGRFRMLKIIGLIVGLIVLVFVGIIVVSLLMDIRH